MQVAQLQAAHAQAAAERNAQRAALEASLHEEQEKGAAAAAERDRTLAAANAEAQAAVAAAAEKDCKLSELKEKIKGADRGLIFILCVTA